MTVDADLDPARLRAWWAHRQGLDDSPKSREPKLAALRSATREG